MINVTPYHRLDKPIKGTLSEINSSQIPYYTKHYMNGTIETKFHVNIIDLLDRVFKQNAPRYTSIEQERFMRIFYQQAGIVTDRINAKDDDPYRDMDKVFKELDNFLGSYRGQKDGRYYRF